MPVEMIYWDAALGANQLVLSCGLNLCLLVLGSLGRGSHVVKSHLLPVTGPGLPGRSYEASQVVSARQFVMEAKLRTKAGCQQY